MALIEHGLQISLSMDYKMAARAFGRARIYGQTCPLGVSVFCLNGCNGNYVFISLSPGQFHKVLFLGTGGRTVFQGTVDEAESYFNGLGLNKPPNVNPADFYMDVIGGTVNDVDVKSIDLFQSWNEYKETKGDSLGSRDFVKMIDIKDGEPHVIEKEGA